MPSSWSRYSSRAIGFFAKEKLYTVSAGGGPPVAICSAPAGRGGAWGRNGTIIYAPEFRSGLFRVAATGGKPEPLTRVEAPPISALSTAAATMQKLIRISHVNMANVIPMIP